MRRSQCSIRPSDVVLGRIALLELALQELQLGHVSQLAQVRGGRRFTGFGPIYRVFALLTLFLPMLVLANYGRISYFGFAEDAIEGFYQVMGFVLSAGAIWLGARRHWNDVVNTGSVGRPKDGDWRAGYAVVEMDGESVDVELIRVEYEVDRAATAIRESDLPDEFAEDLETGGKRRQGSTAHGDTGRRGPTTPDRRADG